MIYGHNGIDQSYLDCQVMELEPVNIYYTPDSDTGYYVIPTTIFSQVKIMKKITGTEENVA